MDEQNNRQFSVELYGLSQFIERHPESFVSGRQDISATALKAAKIVFDLSIQSELTSKSHINDLISSLEPSHAPQTRSRVRTKENRRSAIPPVKPVTTFKITPLSCLFVEGMTEDQVWAQLDLRTNNICDILDLALEVGVGEGEEDGVGSVALRGARLAAELEGLNKGDETDLTDLEDMLDQDQGEEEIYDYSSFDEMEQDQSGGDISDELEEGMVNLQDSSSSSSNDDEEEGESTTNSGKTIIDFWGKKPKANSLDDGFFDLVSFNTETERAEATSSSRGRLGGPEESDDDDDMSVDLFAPIQGESIEEGDPGEALYRDFFEPPSLVSNSNLKKTSKISPSAATPGRVRFHGEVRVKEIRPSGRNLPFSAADEDIKEDISFNEDGGIDDSTDAKPDMSTGDLTDSDWDGMVDIDENEQVRQVMERLKGDLFEEEEADLPQDLSTHEKRLAALQEQITELESANVGPKNWVLMGEADSRTRPQNSLLEEDLEFERVMKAVPVITEETVQILEERIKARIIDDRFDDVVRIRHIEDKAFLPSRFFELTDKKSTQSLAQIYENEFTASQGGITMGEDRDGKLHKEHAEIEHLWESICGKLDALCNSHFMPKQTKVTISTISNVSTAILESALPTTKSVTDMFAPEEIFAPISGDLRARSELNPSEKRILRAKTRKAMKKSRDALDRSVDKYAKVNSVGGVKRQKQTALVSVVKNGKGVTVVGKAKNLLVRQGPKTVRSPRL